MRTPYAYEFGMSTLPDDLSPLIQPQHLPTSLADWVSQGDAQKPHEHRPGLNMEGNHILATVPLQDGSTASFHTCGPDERATLDLLNTGKITLTGPHTAGDPQQIIAVLQAGLDAMRRDRDWWRWAAFVGTGLMLLMVVAACAMLHR